MEATIDCYQIAHTQPVFLLRRAEAFSNGKLFAEPLFHKYPSKTFDESLLEGGSVKLFALENSSLAAAATKMDIKS